MPYEAVIGPEGHVQLLYKPKIFCGCSTQFGSEPDTPTCPVCLAMTGTLPVDNKKASAKGFVKSIRAFSN